MKLQIIHYWLDRKMMIDLNLKLVAKVEDKNISIGGIHMFK